MKSVITLFVTLISLVATGCGTSYDGDVIIDNSSVTVDQGDLSIKIQVIDSDIIHVTKEIKGSVDSSIPDYVTVLEPQDVDWELKQSRDKLTISTSAIKVIVNSDGVIEYRSGNGKHLVADNNSVIDANGTYQAFSVGDEALYGLGQFQSGILDWRNVPMTLRQYNQEVAVPYLVSTNGYGILWNDASVTDVNPAEHEILFEGKAELSKDSFGSATASNTEVEDVAAVKATDDNKLNIRETTFIPEQTGLYTFYVDSNPVRRMKGCVNVTIGDQEVVNYATIWVPLCFSGKAHLEAGKEYKVTFQNSGASIPGRLLYNTPDHGKTVFASPTSTKINYYILAGDTPSDVVALNHKLTGKSPMLDKKYYGFWLMRERYNTQAELLENANGMRDRKIPFDVIIQDWFYWPKGTKGPEWDRAKYPDPAAMAAELDDLNLNLMVSVWPSVNNEPLLKRYDLDKKKLEKTQYINLWDDTASRSFYRMMSDSMFHFGVSSIFLDGTEPEATNTPGDFQTGVGEFKDLTNAYALMVTKSIYEGKREEFPRERVTNLTRSAFSGQQRYGAVTWSGDVQSTWEQFAEQISAGLNFTMAGIPYWTHDVGGFFRDSKSMNPIYDSQYTNPEFIELMTRWLQFGTFSPIFRIHGYKSKTEIWRYTPEFEATARKFIDLRYQLMPYIYSEAWKVTSQGRLIMSPLAYYYPEDKNTWGIADQLFFGESIMAAFVTEYGMRKKEIYLPEGDWFDFWTNKSIKGGKSIIAQAELNQTPLYVKAGSIIPFGPKLQYANEPTNELTHIRVYRGKDAEYTLFFDDNSSYDYEAGLYSELNILYNNARNEITLSSSKDDYILFAQNPMSFVVDLMGGESGYEVTFNGKDVTIKL